MIDNPCRRLGQASSSRAANPAAPGDAPCANLARSVFRRFRPLDGEAQEPTARSPKATRRPPGRDWPPRNRRTVHGLAGVGQRGEVFAPSAKGRPAPRLWNAQRRNPGHATNNRAKPLRRPKRKGRRPDGLFFLTPLPQLHVLHLLAPLALQVLAHQRQILGVAPLFPVFGRGQAELGQMPLGQNLE